MNDDDRKMFEQVIRELPIEIETDEEIEAKLEYLAQRYEFDYHVNVTLRNQVN